MAAGSASTSGTLLALADDTRREIVARLARGPQPAGHLARGFAMSQPAVSKHLRVLRHAGLVHCRRAGRQQIYQLAPEGVAALQRTMDDLARMWAAALPRFKDFLDQEQDL